MNSQRNESLNGTIGSKNPKIRYYGGSESSDFRVACGVAQRNEGHRYICKTLESLGITPGLMIKAVLLSRLAMTQDSIRNTHTQMLWEKGFRGETLPLLVTKYGQNVIPKTHVTLH